jgi:hypothetical protein
MERAHQVGMQGIFILLGLVFIALGLSRKESHPENWFFVILGGLLVAAIILWIVTDKRVLTQEEELEQTLIDGAKRHRRLGSSSAVLDDYRAEGASELTISRVRNGRHLLSQRASASLRTGLLFSGGGLIVLCASMTVLLWKEGDPEQHLLEYGLIGACAGVYHLARGLRLWWHVRQFPFTPDTEISGGRSPAAVTPFPFRHGGG